MDKLRHYAWTNYVIIMSLLCSDGLLVDTAACSPTSSNAALLMGLADHLDDIIKPIRSNRLLCDQLGH